MPRADFRLLKHLGLAIPVAAWAFSAATAAAQEERKPAKERTVVGFTETARVYPGSLTIRAKIDTGARTSSLHAQDIILFNRDGRRWVRFHVTNEQNLTQTFERPVVRVVRIKDLTGPAMSRPVVMLGICIADVFRVTEVNLSDRTGFNFQLLVGRRFMRQAVVVDPGRQFTRAPQCRFSKAAIREIDKVPGLPAAPGED